MLRGSAGADSAEKTAHTRGSPTPHPEAAETIAAYFSGAADPSAVLDRRAAEFLEKQHRVALDRCGEMEATEADDYILSGGYAGLARALSISPEEVIEEVKASGLRGRGGAYFPAALKWEGARKVEVEPRYLVVNSEEGEPGVFKDRHLMEGVPPSGPGRGDHCGLCVGRRTGLRLHQRRGESIGRPSAPGGRAGSGAWPAGRRYSGLGVQLERRDSPRSRWLRLRRRNNDAQHDGRVPPGTAASASVPDRGPAYGRNRR